MLALKHDYAGFVRSADAKASLLREIIEKVQHGEEVDVGKMLGTGDEAKEREWEDGKLSIIYLFLQENCPTDILHGSSSRTR